MNERNNDLFSRLGMPKYPVDLKVLEKTIYIRPYTHGETKPFLELLDGYGDKKKERESYKKLYVAQEQLINNCIMSRTDGEEKINALNLPRADFVHVLVKLKEITKGESTKLKFQCVNDECKNELSGKPQIETIDFNFEDCELINKEHSKESFVETSIFDSEGQEVKIKLHLKPYTFGIIFDNVDLFSGNFKDKQITDNFYASFIEAIEFPDKTFDSLTKQNKADFVSRLFEKQMKPLLEYIENQPYYLWKKVWKCPTCGESNVAKMKELSDFFF